MSQYTSASKSYEGDYVGDDDDMDEDDGYDCLSDCDGDLYGGGTEVIGEGPSGNGERRGDSYSSRSSHHVAKAGVNSNGRHRTEFRRYRNSSERTIPDHSDDNRWVL